MAQFFLLFSSGEMPDNLDAFDERTKLELNMFSGGGTDMGDGETRVRKRKSAILSQEEISNQAEKARKKAELEAKYALWNRGYVS